MSAEELLPCPPMLKEFSFETEGVQSRFVLVHQLRASADIQDNEMTQRMGRKATTDRAPLMREAADAIERLAMSADHIGEATNMVAPVEAVAWRVKVARIVDPGAWEGVYDVELATGFVSDRRKKAGDKADAILQALAVIPPQPDALPGDLRERVDGLLARYFPETLKDERGAACGVSFVVREQRAELVESILALIQTERAG